MPGRVQSDGGEDPPEKYDAGGKRGKRKKTPPKEEAGAHHRRKGAKSPKLSPPKQEQLSNEGPTTRQRTRAAEAEPSSSQVASKETRSKHADKANIAPKPDAKNSSLRGVSESLKKNVQQFTVITSQYENPNVLQTGCEVLKNKASELKSRSEKCLEDVGTQFMDRINITNKIFSERTQPVNSMFETLSTACQSFFSRVKSDNLSDLSQEGTASSTSASVTNLSENLKSACNLQEQNKDQTAPLTGQQQQLLPTDQNVNQPSGSARSEETVSLFRTISPSAAARINAPQDTEQEESSRENNPSLPRRGRGARRFPLQRRRHVDEENPPPENPMDINTRGISEDLRQAKDKHKKTDKDKIKIYVMKW